MIKFIISAGNIGGGRIKFFQSGTGMRLISGHNGFQRTIKEVVGILNAIQDV